MIYDIIMKKRRGGKLSADEIRFAVNGYTDGTIPDYQMSALLMAICFVGLDAEETADLTMAMMQTGRTYDLHSELGHICIDKHSTGGVGDKTSLISAPICAACGVYVPKMSGRGLGHTGGTIDKVESIPGFRTDIPHEEFIAAIKGAGLSVISQSGDLVPADKKMYALRDTTATIDSMPLICSSIMSKKLAMGADGIVIDVKTGDGAFMKTTEEASALAYAMKDLADSMNRKCTCVLTDMDRPLGRCVGNSLEVAEAVSVLKGEKVPELYEVSITLAAHMLYLAECGDMDRCRELSEKAVSDGSALRHLEKMVELQHGDVNALHDISLLGTARNTERFTAMESGYISAVPAEQTGLAALSLGAGRKTKEDTIDKTAGIVFRHSVGDYVNRGDTIAELYSSVSADMSQAAARLASCVTFSSEKPHLPPVVIKEC